MVISAKKGLSRFLLLLVDFPRHWGISTSGIFRTNLLKSCICRRAMVNKIWCREVPRAWFRTKPDRPHARLFSEPGCQNHLALWYLVYRCLVLCAWIGIIVCSILEIGSQSPGGNNHKWPIYLTNWDLLMGATQASVGLAVVLKRWKIQKLNVDPQTMKSTKLDKIYWFLYSTTCTLAIGVTVSYWCAVHDPKIHHVDPLNIMLHVCNSLLMIFDICLTSIPLRLRHFWWPLTIAVPYITFSLIYYAAGGLDKKGRPYIYKVLNWQKPSLAVPICFGGMIFLIVVHCLLCRFTIVKERIYAQNRDKYINENPSNPTCENTGQTVKTAEIV